MNSQYAANYVKKKISAMRGCKQSVACIAATVNRQRDVALLFIISGMLAVVFSKKLKKVSISLAAAIANELATNSRQSCIPADGVVCQGLFSISDEARMAAFEALPQAIDARERSHYVTIVCNMLENRVNAAYPLQGRYLGRLSVP